MRSALRLAAVAAAAACAACAAAPRPAVPAFVPVAGETAAFDGAVVFRMAPGWSPSKWSIWGADAVALTLDMSTNARFHLRDGEPEKDELVQALMKSPWDAVSKTGAYRDGTVHAAGGDAELYRRTVEAMREEPGQEPTFFTDEFVVVPMGKRFLLAVFEAEDHSMPPSPEKLAARDAGWRAMLASLRLKP